MNGTSSTYPAQLPLSLHKDKLVNEVPQANVREKLATALTGQTIELPNLHQYMAGWRTGINKHVARLREDVTKHLHELFEGPRLHSLLAAKPADFAAQWWPDADYDRLRIAAFLSIWLFAWDDETDSKEFSDVSSSLARSRQFRLETVSWCRHCLGLGLDATKTPTNPLLRSFDEVGSALCRTVDQGQRSRLLMEIEFFVAMCEAEQLTHLSHELPSREQYERTRMGTSAVTVCLAITEYTYGIQLPSRIKESRHFETLWRSTNIVISTVNDILSVRKEVANGQVDSLIPILAHQLGNVQVAVDSAAARVQEATELFESAASALHEAFEHDTALPDLRLVIRNCRTACTANLNWSLESGRYRLEVTTLDARPEIIL